MRILFNNGTPRGVAAALREHIVEEARARGWDALRNGELLDAAETAGFDLLLTTDKNIRYQQNLTGRRIAILVLSSGRWTVVKQQLDAIAVAVAILRQAQFPSWRFKRFRRFCAPCAPPSPAQPSAGA